MQQVVTFEIVGLSPLLMHNPMGMRGPEDPIPKSKDEAEAAAYRLANGQLYLASVALRASIIGKGGGAMGRKFGKYTAKSRVSAGVFTLEGKCPLYHPKTKRPIKTYEIDLRRVVVGQGKSIMRARPIIAEWACLLKLEVDMSLISITAVYELLKLSGKIAGVGDFRPAKTGPYGRYDAKPDKATQSLIDAEAEEAEAQRAMRKKSA